MVPVVKNPPANVGEIRDARSIPRLGRPPGEGHGNPLQDSCLENPMDKGAWRATVHGVTQSRTRLSEHTGSKASFYDWRIGAWIYLDEQRQFLTKKFRFGCQNILQRPPQPVSNCCWFPVKPGAILPPGATWQCLEMGFMMGVGAVGI